MVNAKTRFASPSCREGHERYPSTFSRTTTAPLVARTSSLVVVGAVGVGAIWNSNAPAVERTDSPQFLGVAPESANFRRGIGRTRRPTGGQWGTGFSRLAQIYCFPSQGSSFYDQSVHLVSGKQIGCDRVATRHGI